MSGFPNIPRRVDFGPEMRDARPPIIPETDLSANQMNLTFWQVAGAGRVLPQAVLVFDPDSPEITFQALAFDPRQLLGPVDFVVNGTGDYTFTFATTYRDEQGTPVSFTPAGAMAHVQEAANLFGHASVSGQDVNVRVLDSADAADDGIVIVLVW